MRKLRVSSQKLQDLKHKYGVSQEDYAKRLKKQNYGCAICRVHEMKLTRGLYVDHNHKTGKVRGLLCTNCNTALGMLEDSPELLTKAIEYLKNAL